MLQAPLPRWRSPQRALSISIYAGSDRVALQHPACLNTSGRSKVRKAPGRWIEDLRSRRPSDMQEAKTFAYLQFDEHLEISPS